MAIGKLELIKLIDEAIVKEERSIPIYGRHLKTAIFWSGVDAWKQEQIKIYLNILQKESSKHLRVLGEMRDLVQRSEKDVF